MADIFGQAYQSSGSPVSIVSHYLSAYTRGEIPEPPEPCLPFAIRNYDIRKAYVACPFKGIVWETALPYKNYTSCFGED